MYLFFLGFFIGTVVYYSLVGVPKSKRTSATFVIVVFSIAAMFLTACGQDVCPTADYTTSGLCVKTNGYSVNSRLIDRAVKADWVTLQRHGLTNFNLPQMLDDYHVGLIFESPQWSGFKRNGKIKFAGFYDGWNIYVSYERGPEIAYTIMHETLHVVADNKLNASNKDNYYHRVPYLFKEWKRVYHPEYKGIPEECAAADYLDQYLNQWHGHFCEDYPLSINSRDD